MEAKRDVWLIQLRAQRVAAKVIARFAQAGIDALPVKGIVTAHTLYGDISERLVTDVDLKVRPSDFLKVLGVLAQDGIELRQRAYTYGNVVFELDGVVVDVECHPSAPGLSAIDVDTMIKRANPSDLFGAPHLIPDWYDHAVVLVLNVFKDKFVHAFRWAVRDVERLPSHAKFDAPCFVGRLEEARALSIGAVVADWMVEERKIGAWASLRDVLAARAPRRWYVRAHRTFVQRLAHDAMPLRLLNRFGSDSPTARIGALAAAALWSTETRLMPDAGFVRQVLPDAVLVPRRR